MKFVMVLKDPDGIYDSIGEAAAESMEGEPVALNLDGSEDDHEMVERFESRRDKYAEFCDKWVKYGDYVYVQFDTETNEAKVLTLEEYKAL